MSASVLQHLLTLSVRFIATAYTQLGPETRSWSLACISDIKNTSHKTCLTKHCLLVLTASRHSLNHVQDSTHNATENTLQHCIGQLRTVFQNSTTSRETKKCKLRQALQETSAQHIQSGQQGLILDCSVSSSSHWSSSSTWLPKPAAAMEAKVTSISGRSGSSAFNSCSCLRMCWAAV